MTVTYDLSGQTAVVTGAAKGIGGAWPNGSATPELQFGRGTPLHEPWRG